MICCPACGSSHLLRLIDLHRVPIHCNIPQPSKSDAQVVPKGDINLAICLDGGHLHNTTFDPQAVMYGPGYENSLDFSPRFREYLRSLALRLIKNYGLRGKEIMEIACGKGEFLKLLCKLGGNRGIGFDPSHVDNSNDLREDVAFVPDYYTERDKHKADFVGCRHALEHIEYPKTFLSVVRHALKEQSDTNLFFEVPNSEYTLRNLGIWDIIYEHCSYFCDTSLARTFITSGFNVRELRQEYGGQFLSVVAQPANTAEVPSIEEWHVRGSLLEQAKTFKQRYYNKLYYWTRRLEQLSAADARVVIWGAGSKGVTFLNAVKTAKQAIDYAIDIHPEKNGMFVAGTGQQIVLPMFLKGYQPDYVIVMNPIYENEIRKMLQDMHLSPQVLLA